MRSVTWQYALLLVILFALASVAAWSAISHLEEQIFGGDPQAAFKGTVFAIVTLTMGFMLIAGAFGLWAISFSAEAEGRRRVSELVDSMDFLTDGLLAVDARGRIAGANPSARRAAGGEIDALTEIDVAFPCLASGGRKALLSAAGPSEVQGEMMAPGGARALRFRSQPTSTLMLILVSDVTDLRAADERRRQVARLELIGRIARGVAHDFSTILEDVSGQGALLSRFVERPEAQSALQALDRQVARGASLATHLLEFSRFGGGGRPTDRVVEHVRHAARLLEVGLSGPWEVTVDFVDDVPPVALPGVQLEQVVLNLGILAADAIPSPGIVRISIARPGESHLLSVDARFAVVVVVSASSDGSEGFDDDSDVRTTAAEAGIIQSVVRSLIEEAGGSVDFFRGASGQQIYRVALPYGILPAVSGTDEPLPAEMRAYVAGWRVLLAAPGSLGDQLSETLIGADVALSRVDSVMSALARVESQGGSLQGMILEKSLLGDEAHGLIRAIIKLCPRTAIVVLAEDPELEPESLAHEVVFQQTRSLPDQAIRSLIEARGFAVRREA